MPRLGFNVIYLLIRGQAKYGFVAFSDPEDFLNAWKEMDGELLPLLVVPPY